MVIEIREALGADLEKVYTLRYRVYIEEMGRCQKYADHSARTIIEPYDQGADIFAAFDGDRCVGTIRSNRSSASYMGDYPAFYEMGFLDGYHPAATSMTTKLIVDPEYRSTTAMVRLIQTAYVHKAANGVLFDFLDCNDHLVELYRRLGFLVYMGQAHHEEYGLVTPMVFSMADAEHMKEVRSPLLRAGRELDRIFGHPYYELPETQCSVEFFRDRIRRRASGECPGKSAVGASLEPAVPIAS